MIKQFIQSPEQHAIEVIHELVPGDWVGEHPGRGPIMCASVMEAIMPLCCYDAIHGRKGIEFCLKCLDFLCIKFGEFFETPTWYKELTNNLSRVKKIGVDKWVAEQENRTKMLETCGASKGVSH
jgi:hypothetical protein